MLHGEKVVLRAMKCEDLVQMGIQREEWQKTHPT